MLGLFFGGPHEYRKWVTQKLPGCARLIINTKIDHFTIENLGCPSWSKGGDLRSSTVRCAWVQIPPPESQLLFPRTCKNYYSLNVSEARLDACVASLSVFVTLYDDWYVPTPFANSTLHLAL